MRFRILIIISQLIVINAFAQIEVELYFKSACNDSIYKSEYSLLDKMGSGENINSSDGKATVPKASTYNAYISVMNGDFVHSFDYDLIINASLIDTLLIPRITFTTGAA